VVTFFFGGVIGCQSTAVTFPCRAVRRGILCWRESPYIVHCYASRSCHWSHSHGSELRLYMSLYHEPAKAI